jgi:cytoskeletal protein RodZ
MAGHRRGGYTRLPAPVYLKGFLKVYAKALGLDPKQVTDECIAAITATGYKRD